MSTRKLKNSTKKTKSFYGKLLTISLLFVGALLLGRVVLSNVLATSGQRLAAANQKISTLREENSLLQNDFSATISLEKLDEFAKGAGLVKATNVVVLTPATPIASR